jgi:hypothetical protein
MVWEEEIKQSRIEAAIAEAIKVLPSNFVPRHEHGKRCYNVLKHILHRSEYTVIEARQSRLRSFSPARIVATNQRIIIVKPSFTSLYLGRNLLSPTKYVSIPYSNIINITLYTGSVLSTLDINLSASTDIGGKVEGLKIEDAKAMFVFLEELTECLRKDTGSTPVNVSRNSTQKLPELNYISIEMAKSFMKNTGARLLWLGVEPLDQVAERLGVAPEKLDKIGMEELSRMDKYSLGMFEGHIFVCYDGTFSAHVSKFLKLNYMVNSYVLNGGLEGQVGNLKNDLKVKPSN